MGGFFIPSPLFSILNLSSPYPSHTVVANDEFGIVNSLYYHVNNCLAFGGRLEWWKSDRFFQSSRSTYDWTFGLNYRPTANVVIRPELRNDWGAGAIDPTQTVFGVDAIFAF